MLPKFSKITLQNSLDVYHIPLNKGSGVISVDVFYKVGSRDEVMGKSGLAHMLEHMNFKSTKNREAGVFDSTVKSFGGVNNASTGFDYTHYFIKCSSKNLSTCLELYADIMENLSLSKKEFEPERNVVLEERIWRTDNNPFGYLFFRLYNNAFIYHPYHWTPIGFRDDIKNWSIKDLREFHAKFYQPQNAAIVVCGDIDESSVFEETKKYFGSIKNRHKLPKFHTYEPALDGEKIVYLKKQSEVELFGIAYKIPPFNHADITNIKALGAHLGSGKSSILERILVDEKQLLNQVAVYEMCGKDENLLIIMGICNEGVSAEKSAEEIKKICEEIKSKEIPPDEIEKIHNNAKSEFIYSLDSASKVSSLFGEYIALGDLTPLFDYEKNISALCADSIKSVAQKYLINPITVILRKD